jgi:hypothetical protein
MSLMPVISMLILKMDIKKYITEINTLNIRTSTVLL